MTAVGCGKYNYSVLDGWTDGNEDGWRRHSKKRRLIRIEMWGGDTEEGRRSFDLIRDSLIILLRFDLVLLRRMRNIYWRNGTLRLS